MNPTPAPGVGNCDFERENSLKKILLSLEKQFQEHYVLFHSTMVAENDIIDAMWVLCQRFLILTKGAICVRPYPREPSNREERETRTQFTVQKQLLHGSNTKLTASLYKLREKCGAFDRALAKVDCNLPSHLVEGDMTRQPIYYYIDLFGDLFKFFHDAQNKLNLLGNFLMIEDMSSIMEYKHLLKPDGAVNEYFEKCLNVGNKSEM